MVRFCTYLSFVISIMKQQLTSVKGVIELDVSDIILSGCVRIYKGLHNGRRVSGRV